jgi:ribose/xylose/arabinose/galactoside ABC-type transport system permease subunit
MVGRLLRSEYFVLLLSGILFAILAPITPGLASTGNLANLAANLLPLLVVAIGQTLVLIAGGIDLSVTATIALSSVVGAFVMNGDNGWLRGSALASPLGIGAMLAVGAAVGACNGLAVTRLRMPAFIVTLTSNMFFSGLAVWLTQSQPIYNLPQGFTRLGSELGWTLLIAGSLAIAVHLALTRLVFGRWLYAVGHNQRAAHVSGVPVNGVLVAAYIACGVLAAAASVLYTGRLETGSPVLGQRILLDVIGATVIGGTSLFGGKGKVLWTLFGVLFLTLLDNALNLAGLSYFAIMMTKGGVIVLAALLDAARSRWFAA